MWPSNMMWRTRCLVYSLLVTTIMGLAVHLAASIALLPRLEWRPAQNIFSYMDSECKVSPLSHCGFSLYISRNTLPAVGSSSSLSLPDADAQKTVEHNPSSKITVILGPKFRLRSTDIVKAGASITCL